MDEIHLQAAAALIWVPLYLFLAGYYLVFHFRDRLRHHLLFAFLWFCWAIYALGASGLYASHSPAEGVRWQRVQLLGAIFAYPTVFLFMVRQAGLAWRDWIAISLYAASTLFAVANFTSAAFFTDTPAVKEFTFLGHLVRYQECEPGWLGAVCFCWGILLLFGTIGLGVLAMRRRTRGSVGIFLGLSAVGLASINDSLVGLGVYESVYMVEHVFVIFAFTAAYFMQDQTLQAQQELWHKTQRLIAANRDLEGLDRLKEELLANVSHELRTPLVSIRGYSEYIRDGKMGPVTPEQAGALEICLRSVERLLGLINNLLDHAKLRDGRMVLDRQDMPLIPVVEDALAGVAPLLDQRGLELDQAYDDSARIWVHGDAGRLRQVVDNLLVNAVKASRESASVRIEMGLDADQWAWLAVADSGKGIPASKLDQIFDRFYQAGPGEQGRRLPGTGLGLAVVRELVQLHGGELRVTSAEEEGSRFEVRLPAVEPPAAAPALTERRRTAAAPEPEARAPRVLVADDDPDISAFLELALDQAGHQVELASDGQRALELGRTGRFELLLLDINMSGLSGDEVLAKLRQGQSPGASMKVVIITASRSDDVRRRCEELGCDGFLLKPFSLQKLLAEVSEQIERG